MKKYLIIPLIAFLFIGLVSSSGCVRKPVEETGPAGAFIGGKQGLTMSFLADEPSSEIDECLPFSVAIDLENKGEADISEAKIILGGTVAHGYGIAELSQSIPDLLGAQKIGKEEIPGEEYTLYWDSDGSPNYPGEQPIKITAKACYEYETKVQATACVKESTYRQATGAPELCKASGEIKFFNSGAPVHVNTIRQSLVAGGPTLRFSIKVEDVGKGAAYDRNVADCANLTTRDMDIVEVEEARLVNLDKTGDCVGDTVNLPGSVTCQFDIDPSEVKGEAEDVLVLRLAYGYTQDMTKKATILNAIPEPGACPTREVVEKIEKGTCPDETSQAVLDAVGGCAAITAEEYPNIWEKCNCGA